MDGSAGVGMKFWRAARVSGVLILGLICVSCGDQYRPVAIPIVPPPPDPQAVHFVLVFSVNGASDPGASSRVDVSGDSNIGVAQLGRGPAHATLIPNGARVYAVNTREDSVSSYSPTPGSTATSVTTTSLPAGSNPVFVHTTEGGTVYVANFGLGTVAAISITTNVVLNPLITVGTNPVALAETPDQKKLYAVNQGDGSVTPINLTDRPLNPAVVTGSTPVWAVARADSARIYVLNSGGGTVSTIDTTTDTLLSSVAVGAGANYMAYDGKLNRLYVNNPTVRSFGYPALHQLRCYRDQRQRRQRSKDRSSRAHSQHYGDSAKWFQHYLHLHLHFRPRPSSGNGNGGLGHGRRGERRNIHTGRGKRGNLHGRQRHRDHGGQPERNGSRRGRDLDDESDRLRHQRPGRAGRHDRWRALPFFGCRFRRQYKGSCRKVRFREHDHPPHFG